MSDNIDKVLQNNPLLKGNHEFLVLVSADIEEKIEIDNPRLARLQLQKSVSMLPRMARLKSKAEYIYRIEKEKVAIELDRSLKADARTAALNSQAAIHQYARDLLEAWHDALKGKISAIKTVLHSLSDEMKNQET